MRYTLLPAAIRDLDDQALYIGEAAGLDTALRFYDAAARTFDLLTRSPGIGEPRRSSKPGLEGMRVCSVRGFAKHLVFYRVHDETVEVVRILHGHRDLTGFFDLDED